MESITSSRVCTPYPPPVALSLAIQIVVWRGLQIFSHRIPGEPCRGDCVSCYVPNTQALDVEPGRGRLVNQGYKTTQNKGNKNRHADCSCRAVTCLLSFESPERHARRPPCWLSGRGYSSTRCYHLPFPFVRHRSLAALGMILMHRTPLQTQT